MWKIGTNSSLTCVRYWYQFLTCVRYWYQFFTRVKNWYQFISCVKNRYQFFTRQKLSTCEIWAQISDPKIYRFWPYVNITFCKYDVLVPVLLTGVKFTKCEIYGSTKHTQLSSGKMSPLSETVPPMSSNADTFLSAFDWLKQRWIQRWPSKSFIAALNPQ